MTHSLFHVTFQHFITVMHRRYLCIMSMLRTSKTSGELWYPAIYQSPRTSMDVATTQAVSFISRVTKAKSCRLPPQLTSAPTTYVSQVTPTTSLIPQLAFSLVIINISLEPSATSRAPSRLWLRQLAAAENARSLNVPTNAWRTGLISDWLEEVVMVGWNDAGACSF